MKYNFKVGDRVKFKNTAEHQDYRNERNFPNEFVITGFDDINHDAYTLVAFKVNGYVGAVYLTRLERVESSSEVSIQDAIDTLVKAGYKVTLSKE